MRSHTCCCLLTILLIVLQSFAVDDIELPEITCADCRSLGVLIDGTLTKIPCGEGKFCKGGNCGTKNTCKEKVEQCEDESSVVQDPEDCGRYFSCQGHHRGEVVFCPFGQVFDSRYKVCLEQGTCSEAACENTTDHSLLPYESDSRLYFICRKDKPVEIASCELDKQGNPQEFDAFSKECVHACTQPGLFPISGDCELFVHCLATKISGKYLRVVRQCPSGTSFDDKIKGCSPDVPCTKSKSRSTTIPTTSQSTTITHSTTTESLFCDCPPGGRFCPCPEREGLFEIPGHCDKYIRSIQTSSFGDFKRFVETCPKGTVFSSYAQSCGPRYDCFDFMSCKCPATGEFCTC